jgi:Excreted virulence factor EspC, type VII ESX diderm
MEIDTEQLAGVAGRQAQIAARLAELRSELDAAGAGASGAAGTAGLAGAIDACGAAWSAALGQLAVAVQGHAHNAGAAATAYRETDANAMPGSG